MRPKWKQCPVVDVTGDGSKVWCCKEQYCIGTWNVRSMNQDKLEVVKQEMARVNINILGISELKWTGNSEFDSDDHYIYYNGKETHRRNGIALIVNKSLKCSTWVQSQKQQNDFCLFPRQTIQHHSNPSLCHNHWCWGSWNWLFLWRPTTHSRTNTRKRCPFHHRTLECKVGSKETPRVQADLALECGAKANRNLPREHTGHSKYPFPATQEITLHMDITRWSILKSDQLCSLYTKMEKHYTVSKNKSWSWW